jgi:hypothetical protein
MCRIHRLVFAIPAVFSVGCDADQSVNPNLSSNFVPRHGFEASVANNRDKVPHNKKVYCLNATSCFAVATDFTNLREDLPLDIGRSAIFSVYLQNLQGTYPSSAPSSELRLRLLEFRFFETKFSASWLDVPDHPLTFSTVGNVEVGRENSWLHETPPAGVNFDW